MNKNDQKTFDSLKEKLIPFVGIDSDSGVVSVKEGAVEATLPEGISIDQFNAVHQHTAFLGTAFVDIGVGHVLSAMKDNKDLESGSGSLDLAPDVNLAFSTQRSKTITVGNPAKPDEPRKEVTNYGVTTVAYTTALGTQSKGMLKKALMAHRELAKEMLG